MNLRSFRRFLFENRSQNPRRHPKIAHRNSVETMMVESLETRAMPSVGFDTLTGALSVAGDESGDKTNDRITASVDSTGLAHVTINSVEKLTGVQAVNVKSIVIQGLDGNDTLTVKNGFTAASGQITLDGGFGKDKISGSSSLQNLILLGGDGNDRITGGKGNDNLDGGSGTNKLFGGDGNDTLIGGNGDESISGGRGDDSIIGGAGNCIINSGSGNDTINSGGGNDLIHVGNGDDLVFGNGGNDFIFGGSGNDTLSGGGGNDVVRGGSGKNLLDVSEGRDKFTGGITADFDNTFDATLTGVNGNTATGSAILKMATGTVTPKAIFQVTITGAVAGSNLVVTVGGSNVGTITVDSSGNGQLTFDRPVSGTETDFPNSFPQIEGGTTIKVGSILKGTFTEP